MHPHARRRLLLAATLLTPHPLLAYNQPYYFVGPTDSLFSDPNNWSPSPTGPGGTPPANDDNAYVTPTSSLTLTLDAPPNNVSLNLTNFAGPSPDAPLTVSSAANFGPRYFYVGPNVTFNQSAATIAASFIGIAGPNTSYSLSGNASLSAGHVTFGTGSTLSQAGGDVHSENEVTIASSRYSLSAGLIGADDVFVDSPSPTSFSQTGGSVGGYYSTLVGRNASYTLAAGFLGSTFAVRIGGTPKTSSPSFLDSGSTLTQTGGTLLLDRDAALIINATPNSSALYALSAGTLTTTSYGNNRLYIGQSTTGTLLQTGGSIGSPSSTIPYTYVGYEAGSTGTYSLSNTGTLTTANLYVGYNGNASLTQSGGLISLTSLARLTLAYGPSSSASYSLSAGSLSATTTTLADQGSATFSQSGGIATFQTFTLANTPSSSATLTLSAGTFTTTNTSNLNNYIAYAGSATVNQTGGTLTAGENRLTLASQPTATATYTLSGGSLIANSLTIGDQGSATLNLAGGLLNPGISLLLAGTLNHSAGSLYTSSLFLAGRSPSLPALYALTGGDAHANAINVNNAATLSQSAGTLFHTSGFTLNSTDPNAPAAYLLSGTGSSGGDSIDVATTGYASVSQTGGSADGFYYVRLARDQGSSAQYSLSNGSLTSSAFTIAGAGSATFLQTGGTLTTTPGVSNPSVLTLAAGPTATASYTLTAGTLSIDKAYIANAGSATFSQSGGSATFTSFTLANTPSSSATLNLSGGTFGITDNTSSINNYIAYAGSATVNQTGGTFTLGINNRLILAAQPNSSATYTLSNDAVLYTRGLTVGDQGSATFNLNGGTLHASGLILHGTFNHTAGTFEEPTITLTGTSPAPARYTFSAGYINSYSTTLNAYSTFAQSGGRLFYSGTLTLNGTNSLYTLAGDGTTGGDAIVIGDTSTGTFLQSGGHAGANYFTTLGNNAGSTGYYQLSAGELHTANLGVGAAGNGTFLQTGGTLSLNDTTSSLIVGSGPSATGYYTMTAGTIDGYETSAHLTVAYAGQASFTQSGGTLTSIRSLVLANWPSSSASYTLSAGSISTLFATIANQGTATFTQTGGTLSFPSFNYTTLTLANAPNSSATYLLAGGSLLAAPTTLANAGHAYLLQTGGTFTTPSLTIAAQPGSNGTYDLLAGSLTTPTLTNNGTLYASPNASLSLQTLTNSGSLTLDGSQSWPANSTLSNTLVTYLHSDPTPTGTPTLNFSSASPNWAPVIFDAPTIHLASLTLTSTTHATNSSYLTTGPLTITDTAQLDLTTSTLLTTTPPDTIRQYLLNNALTSTSTDPTHRLAYLTTDGTTRITLTPTGDANLDGQLNADDYALLDRGYAQHLTTWQGGDFNYDGIVNNQDYLLLDTTYAQQGGPLSPTFLAQRESQFGPQYVSTLLASLPEPALPLFSILYPLSSLLFRHRRRPIHLIIPVPVPTRL